MRVSRISAGGSVFVLLVWLYCLLSPTLTSRSWLVASLITLWAAPSSGCRARFTGTRRASLHDSVRLHDHDRNKGPGPAAFETGDCRPILDSSPRVCPESSRRLRASRRNSASATGWKTATFRSFFSESSPERVGIERSVPGTAPAAARHPRLRATPQSTHARDTYVSKAAVC
jgi:hypothetical protein